jgi:hypothetical protein
MLNLAAAASPSHIGNDPETRITALLRIGEFRRHSPSLADSLLKKFIFTTEGALDPNLPPSLVSTYLSLAVVSHLLSLVRRLLVANGDRIQAAERVPPLLASERVVIKAPLAVFATYLDVVVNVASSDSLRLFIDHLEQFARSTQAIAHAPNVVDEMFEWKV